MEDKKYCIYCGTENNSNDETCIHCHKELNPKENLFIDFLKSKTKDQFLGNTEDSLYEAIKGFILSHLYGSIVTLSIVAVVCTSVINVINKPYVHYDEATSRPYISITDDNTNNNTTTTHQYDQSDYDAIENIVYNYVQAIAYGGDASTYIVKDEHNINTYFDYYFSYLDEIEEVWRYEDIDINSSIFETNLSKQLIDEGYLVANQNVWLQNSQTGGSSQYNTLLVRIDGQWYIAQFVDWSKL